MSDRARWVLFFAISFVILVGTPPLLERLGLAPAPAPAPRAEGEAGGLAKGGDAGVEGVGEGAGAVAKGEGAKEGAGEGEATADAGAGGDGGGDSGKEVELVDPRLLVLGAAGDSRTSPRDGYRLEVRLSQLGAGVDTVRSALYDAERERKREARRPLTLVESRRGKPALGLDLLGLGAPGSPGSESGLGEAGGLSRVVWEVVPGDDGRLVVEDENTQRLSFATTTGSPPLRITKTYVLRRGEDGFDVELKFEAPEAPRELTYRLLGPYGIPIEGVWYTMTYRDFFHAGNDRGRIDVVTWTAYNVGWYYGRGRDSEERFQTLPLQFAGIENRYFATFLAPVQEGPGQEGRIDRETVAVELFPNPADRNLSEIGVEVDSRPVVATPDRPATHRWRVFAGPKRASALSEFGVAGAEELAQYRAGFAIPGSLAVSKYLITPLLSGVYGLLDRGAKAVGLPGGNYGVAIILLTCLIRLGLYPLSKKQVLMTKKMQDLQPLVKEIQAKYAKDGDLTKLTNEEKFQMQRDTMALYKRHNVSIVGAGCLPALIQLPIMVGLWQSLNNNVDLRQAPFLYMSNLAAPDMLFQFGGADLPILGRYFNLLPLVAMVLMIAQMKLFSPPATTPEMETQQKMFLWMTVIFGFMFYKLPSGLVVYFITSSVWQLLERTWVNRLAKRKAVDVREVEERAKAEGGGKPAAKGWLARLMEAAEHERTIRNEGRDPKSARGELMEILRGGKGGGDHPRHGTHPSNADGKPHTPGARAAHQGPAHGTPARKRRKK